MECNTRDGQSALQRITKALEDWEPITSPTSQEEPPERETPRSLQRVISVSDFEHGAYQRMQQCQRRKEERLKQARALKEAQALAEVRPSPSINDSKAGGNRASLVERAADIVQKQKEWRERQLQEQRAKSEEKETAELTFHPKILAQPRCRRTVAEFEVYLDSSKDKHETYLKRLKEDAEARTVAELVFKPTISQRSLKLMKDKGNLEQRLEEESLMSGLRKGELRKKYEPPFRPAISPMSARLAEQHAQLPVHQRLYPTPPTLRLSPQQPTLSPTLQLLSKDFLSS